MGLSGERSYFFLSSCFSCDSRMLGFFCLSRGSCVFSKAVKVVRMRRLGCRSVVFFVTLREDINISGLGRGFVFGGLVSFRRFRFVYYLSTAMVFSMVRVFTLFFFITRRFTFFFSGIFKWFLVFSVGGGRVVG